MKILDYTILTLVIVGAVNWGLIGFFDFDLVSTLFGQMSLLTRIIYAAVGIGGLYAISYYGRMNSEIQFLECERIFLCNKYESYQKTINELFFGSFCISNRFLLACPLHFDTVLRDLSHWQLDK